MEILTHIQNTFRNEKCQKELEAKATSLLLGPLKYKSEYSKEKAIKSFSEGLHYLEDLLLMQRGIHPSNFKNNSKFSAESYKEDYSKKYLEVENIILSSIARQFRHFLTFL